MIVSSPASLLASLFCPAPLQSLALSPLRWRARKKVTSSSSQRVMRPGPYNPVVRSMWRRFGSPLPLSPSLVCGGKRKGLRLLLHSSLPPPLPPPLRHDALGVQTSSGTGTQMRASKTHGNQRGQRRRRTASDTHSEVQRRSAQPPDPARTARLLVYDQQPPKTKLLINGEFVDSKTSQWMPVKNPVRSAATQPTPRPLPQRVVGPADRCPDPTSKHAHRAEQACNGIPNMLMSKESAVHKAEGVSSPLCSAVLLRRRPVFAVLPLCSFTVLFHI